MIWSQTQKRKTKSLTVINNIFMLVFGIHIFVVQTTRDIRESIRKTLATCAATKIIDESPKKKKQKRTNLKTIPIEPQYIFILPVEISKV